jgi:MoaA/NifB/PqqE/SkfB family radical SAM enzyme
MNFRAFLNTVSDTARTLPIIILYVTESCNLKCITCSYRDALPGELSLDEIKELASRLGKLGLRHIVYSGGEPLLRRDFMDICETFAVPGVKQTLLTNGLLLEKRIKDLYKYFTEIIVSIDGANAETHNAIRGINSFDQITKGIKTLVSLPSRGDVSIRCVIQKKNYSQLADMVELAKSLGVNRISFLSADVLPGAFGRDKSTALQNEGILLSPDEINELRGIIDNMMSTYKEDFESGFISETPAKLLHLAEYFEAHTGKSGFPKTICNAPMVSAVITSTGEIQPCFFLPSFGNIRKSPVKELINHSSVKETRNKVRRYELERCKTCVCTLNISSRDALSNNF